MKISNFIFLLLALSILAVPIVSAQIILPQYPQGYSIAGNSGNESILFNSNITEINSTTQLVGIFPQFATTKVVSICDGNPDTCTWRNITLTQSNQLRVTTEQGSILINKIAGRFLYLVPKILQRFEWIRFGESSITLTGDASYNSTDVNVTQEAGYSHLSIINKSIVLFTPYDVNATIQRDFAITSYDGTPSGAYWTNYGWMSGAMKFDGIDDYIDYTDLNTLDGLTEMSACAWVNHSDISSDDEIIAKNSGGTDGFLFFRDDNGANSGRNDTYTILVADGGTTNRIEGADSISVVGAWKYICFTFKGNDANGLRLYINGVEDANSPASTSGILDLNAGTNPLRVGSSSTGGAAFNGSIDGVIIFNKTLSATDIVALNNSAFQRFNANGEQMFKSLNFGTNNTLNISLASCQTFAGSNLSVSINHADFINLTSCKANNLTITGDKTNTNITFKYTATGGGYSPLIIGNITLDSWLYTPPAPLTTIPSVCLQDSCFGIDNLNIPIIRKSKDGVYGEMWNKQDAGFEVVNLVTPEVYVRVQNLTSGQLSGVAHSNGNMTIGVNGKYKIDATISLEAAGNSEYGIKVFKNNTSLTNCYAHVHLASGNADNVGISCMVSLARNDVIDIRIDDHSNPVNDPTLVSTNLNILRVSN